MSGQRQEESGTDFHIVENVNVVVEAELDRKRIPLLELVNLEVGSVIQLDRPTGENVDLYVGSVLVGNGEVLVLDGVLAVRVADLRHKNVPRPARSATVE